jgi:hypothetical protein
MPYTVQAVKPVKGERTARDDEQRLTLRNAFGRLTQNIVEIHGNQRARQLKDLD